MKSLIPLLASAALLLLSCEKRGVEGADAMREAVVQVQTHAHTRTALGEASGGVCPVIWQEGDVISVNGLVSDALTSAAGGATVAEFRIPGLGVADTYHYLYPGNADGRVTIDGTSMPMYAVGTSLSEGAVLSHLCCGARLGLTGIEKIASITLRAPGGESPGGEFSVSFAGGALSPVNAVSSITLSFSPAVRLSEESATPFYVFFAPAYYSGGIDISVTSDKALTRTWHFGTGATLTAGKIYDLGEAVFGAEDHSRLGDATIEDLGTVSFDM